MKFSNFEGSGKNQQHKFIILTLSVVRLNIKQLKTNNLSGPTWLGNNDWKNY